MPVSPSQRKKQLRDRKIAVAVFHYVHHTTDFASIAETLNVPEQTLTQWQKTQKWHNEMNFYASENTALCDTLGLGELQETDDAEVDGSLTNFAWVWGHIFQEGLDLDQIDNRKRIGGHRMHSEQKCRLKQIGIENVFQRYFRVARIGYQNIRAWVSQFLLQNLKNF